MAGDNHEIQVLFNQECYSVHSNFILCEINCVDILKFSVADVQMI